MIARLISSLIWVRMLALYYQGNIPRARRYLSWFEKLGQLDHEHRAFAATLLIQEHEYEAARELFLDVLAKIGTDPRRNTENVIFTKLYCQYYLTLKGDPDAAASILKEAGSRQPTLHYRRTLPLPPANYG